MRRFPPLRPEVLALLAATLASPAFAGDPAAATKGAPQTEPAKPGAPLRKLGENSSLSVQGGDLMFQDNSTLTMYRLHPVAAAVFLLADGQKSLAALRTEAEASSGLPVDEATLFAVLDALADANLLASRVTPPGSSDLASFVLVDGTIGNALVETGKGSTAQAARKLKLPDAKVQESAAKQIRRPMRVIEANQKKQTEFLDRAAKTTGMAREEAKKVHDRMRDREMNMKAKREAPGAGATADEAAIPVLKQRSEVLAKSESVMRKRSEEKVKMEYANKALPGEDDASLRKRQGASEEEAKVVKTTATPLK
jgi:hypothetical protein